MTWFQMTYASASATTERRGGWGVLEKDAGTPDGLAQFMEQGVTTQLDTGAELAEFSSEATLARRQRAISFWYEESSGAAWWHACEAGHDVTGRPGNVFNHVVATPCPDPGLRPVSLVHSPSWLTPFGYREVAGAHIGQFVVPDQSDLARRVLEGALADAVRTEALLAAVAHCFHEHRPLVLVGESIQVIEALERASWLTAGRVSSSIPFSTFDRARRLPKPGSPFLILGVPSSDREEALRRARNGQTGALVLDLDWAPEEVPDDKWAVDGQEWPVDLWQDAFYKLSDLPLKRALEVAHSMDAICADLSPTELLSPSWPLNLALLKYFGEEHSEVESLRSAWARAQPWDSLGDPELRALLRVDEVDLSLSRQPGTPASPAPPFPQWEVDTASTLTPVVREALEVVWREADTADPQTARRLRDGVRLALGGAAAVHPPREDTPRPKEEQA